MVTYFEFTQKAGDNFTPSAKIYQFAREHYLKAFDHYGSTVLCFLSGNCKYSHYKITPIENGLERVTIYLEEVTQCP